MINEGHQSKNKCPIIIDFIGNNNQSRFLTSFIILLVYIVIVFTIFPQQKIQETEIESIKVESGIGSSLLINKFVNDSSIFPRVKLVSVDQSTYLGNITVQLVLSDLNSDQSFLGDFCNLENRQQIAGTLEFIRMEEFCKVETLGAKEVTDSNGRAVFKDFKIIRGPTGNYGFKYRATNLKNKVIMESEYFNTYFDTEIMKIQIIQGLPPDPLEIGVAFKNQPKIQVVDIQGRPISGKQIIAFSWPEPQFSKMGVKIEANQFLYQHSQFALLNNSVSSLSDENGIAEFQNLTIVAMTYFTTYIFFNCDNKFQILWQIPRSTLYDALSLPITRYPLIYRNVANQNLIINQEYSRTVVQGERFIDPIQITIFDSQTKEGLEGKIAFATIIAFNQIEYSFGYRYKSQPNQRLKEIIQPIPANYNEQFGDPLLQDSYFQEIRSNQEGELVFSEMYFSTYGQAGLYQLKIWCEGAFIETEFIEVKSKVTKISFLQQPPAFFLLESMEIQQFNPIIKIEDSSGRGINGKMARFQIFNPMTQEIIPTSQLGFPTNFTVNQPSDEDGIIELRFQFDFSVEQETPIIIQAEVDGIKSQFSAECYLINYLKSKEHCGAVISNQKTDQIDFQINVDQKLEFTVLNELGNPLPGAIVVLINEILFSSISIVPLSIYPIMTCSSNCVVVEGGVAVYSISNNIGVAQFTDLQIIDGANTLYEMQYIAITGLDLSSKRILQTENISQNEEIQEILAQLKIHFDWKDYQKQQRNLGISIDNTDGNSIDQDNNFSNFMSEHMNQGIFQINEDISDASNIIPGKENGMKKTCYSNKALKFRLITNIQKIVWMSDSPSDRIHPVFSNFVQKTYLLLDQNSKPIPRYPLMLSLQLIHLPGSYIPLYLGSKSQKDFLDQIVYFQQLTPISEDDGSLKFMFALKKTSKGYFGFNMKGENIRSDPLLLVSSFDADSLYIIEQPQSNFGPTDELTFFKTGNFLNIPTKLILKDKNGAPLPDYPIIANIDRSFANASNVLFDGGDMNEETTLALGFWRISYTDKNGIASFDKLTVTDVRGSTCLKFFFAVGDLGPIFYETEKNFCDQGKDVKRNGMCVKSQSTNIFCFTTDFQATIVNQDKYSKLVAPGNPFDIPITAQIFLKKLTDLEKLDYFFVAASLYSVDGIEEIKNPTIQSDMMTSDWFCIVSSGLQVEFQQNPSCRFKILPSKTHQKILEVTFTQLSFKAFRAANVRVSVSTILNYKHSNETNITFDQLLKYGISEIKAILTKVLESDPKVYQDSSKLLQIQSLINQSEMIENLQIALDNTGSGGKRSLEESKFQSQSTNLYLLINNFYKEIMNLIQIKNESSESNKIIISTNPKQIVILTQPSVKCYYKEIIRVKVGVFVTTKSPLKMVSVDAILNPVASGIGKLGPVGIEDFLNRLVGSGDPLTFTQNRFNIQIESKKFSQQTDEKGIAQYNLQFLSGQTGIYNLKFESKGFQSQLTTNFILINQIISANYLDWASPIQLENAMGAMVPIFQTGNLSIKIEYLPDIDSLNYQKELDIQIFKFKYSNDGYNQPNMIQIQLENIREDFREKKYNKTTQSIKDKLNQIYEVVLNGGKFLSRSLNPEENLKISYKIEQKINGDIEISELKIQFMSPGDYQIIVLIDGIQTPPSPMISVFEPEKSQQDQIIGIFRLIVLIFLIILTVTINISDDPGGSANNNKQNQNCTIIFAILILNLLNFYFLWEQILENSNSMNEFPLSLIFKIIACIYLFVILIDLAVVNLNKNQNQQFCIMKGQFQFQYTQHALDQLFQQSIPQKNQDQKNFIQTDQQKNESPFFQNLLLILTPISKLKDGYYGDRWFYYPQSVISSLLISQFAIAYISFQLITYVINFYDSLSKFLSSVEDSYTDFVSSAIQNSDANQFSINEETFQEMMYAVFMVIKTFKQIIDGLFVALSIGYSSSLILYFANFFGVLFDFQEKVTKSRKGEYDSMQRNSIKFEIASNYIPYHISNEICGFVITTFFIGIIISPLFMQIFWVLLWDYQFSLAVIILGVILNQLIMMVSQKIAFDGPHSIKIKVFVQIIDFVISIERILAGILSAITKFFLLIITLGFSFQTIYKTVFPNWIYIFIGGDRITQTYEAMLLIYSVHNNPIANTFVQLLLDTQQSNQKFIKKISNKTRNAFWKVVVMKILSEQIKIGQTNQIKFTTESIDHNSDQLSVSMDNNISAIQNTETDNLFNVIRIRNNVKTVY